MKNLDRRCSGRSRLRITQRRVVVAVSDQYLEHLNACMLGRSLVMCTGIVRAGNRGAMPTSETCACVCNVYASRGMTAVRGSSSRLPPAHQHAPHTHHLQ